jgi:hypothetical protein
MYMVFFLCCCFVLACERPKHTCNKTVVIGKCWVFCSREESMLWSYGLWYHILWKVGTKVSHEDSGCNIRIEGVSRLFLRNFCIFLIDHKCRAEMYVHYTDSVPHTYTCLVRTSELMYEYNLIFLNVYIPPAHFLMHLKPVSQSHVTTDGQSVIMSRYRAHSGTYFSVTIFKN